MENKGSGALSLSDGHSDCGRLPGEGSSWLLSSSGRTLGKKHQLGTSHLPTLCPHSQSCQDPSGSRVRCSWEAPCFLESSRDRGAAHRLGPCSLTALMHREKPLEAKLKTKILLSMITSQVLILTLLCGSFKLCFWKLLASPRSTTKI